MGKDRVAAFSDGVIAILITIMVLELKIPQKTDLESLLAQWPVFLGYVLSFVYVGIYWNNHHHTMQAAESVNGAILWANLDLLFWLSLIPVATAWMGQNLGQPLPTALYGVSLLLPAIAYYLLVLAIIRRHGAESILAKAIGSDIKGKISPVLYIAGIALAFVTPWVSIALYVVVAVLWLVPDRRIENLIARE